MRKNFAGHTAPLALSLTALVVAASGTAAAATSVIVTKNQQVASHVIAGAKAPKGDHKNIVSGSIGSTDLHAGSVSSSALAPGSVTAAKLNLPKFNVSMTDAGLTPVSTTLVAIDGLSLGLTCVDSADNGHIEMHLSATSSHSGAKVRGTFDGLTNAGPILTGNVTADTNSYTMQDLSTTPVSLLDNVGSNVSAANLTTLLTYFDAAGHVATVLMNLSIIGTGGGAFTCGAAGNVVP
jgi:hypothetical protein